MGNKTAATVHWSFWLISIITLVWNVMGAINFVVQMFPEMISAYRESERAIIQGRPLWATIGFAVAVFGGSLGSFFLLLKKPVSYYFFVASLLAVIVTTAHTLSMGISFGIVEMFGIILMPLAVAVFLIWYARYVQRRAWVS